MRDQIFYAFILLMSVAALPARFALADESDTRAVAEINLIHDEDVSSWEGMVKTNTEIKRSGDFSFELYGKYPTELLSKEMMPVDKGKRYILSAYLRSLGEPPASAFFGLRMYDGSKNPITIANVGILDNTETTLASDGPSGANELRVYKNTNWMRFPSAVIAFNAKSNFQDLPNNALSPQIEKVIHDGDFFTVSLKGPLGHSYPKGTMVRLHSPWGAPFYWAASGWMPSEWSLFSATMQGESQSGTPNDQFWKGTKYVRVFVWFGNYDKTPKEGARLLVDDISLICREKSLAEIALEKEWEQTSAAQQSLALMCAHPNQTTAYDKQWRFATDSKDEGLATGWMRSDFPDQNWALLDADRWCQDQGYKNYHGVVWYRKTIPSVALGKGGKCFIYFGAIDGDASVFVNGKKVGDRRLGYAGKGWNSPITFEITDCLVAGGQNSVAVRICKNQYKSGITKGVAILTVDQQLKDIR